MRIQDKIYSEYRKQTNMSFKELMKWKNNPLSKKASLNRKPINLALRLAKKKKEWSLRYYKGALKAIAYLKRAKKIKSKNYVKGTKLTYNDIALRNWGYNSKKKGR